jgi:N-methylhydantoinase A
VIASFHEAHERTFGHSAPDVMTEIVSARMAGIGLRAMPRLAPSLAAQPGASYDNRPVVFDRAAGPAIADIYRREDMAAGQTICGPAIVEQLDTTTVIPPGCLALVHESGSLIVRAVPERSA